MDDLWFWLTLMLWGLAWWALAGDLQNKGYGWFARNLSGFFVGFLTSFLAIAILMAIGIIDEPKTIEPVSPESSNVEKNATTATPEASIAALAKTNNKSDSESESISTFWHILIGFFGLSVFAIFVDPLIKAINRAKKQNENIAGNIFSSNKNCNNEPIFIRRVVNEYKTVWREQIKEGKERAKQKDEKKARLKEEKKARLKEESDLRKAAITKSAEENERRHRLAAELSWIKSMGTSAAQTVRDQPINQTESPIPSQGGIDYRQTKTRLNFSDLHPESVVTQRVSFSYQDSAKDLTHRTVLVNQVGTSHFGGICTTRSDSRSFRYDRIIGAVHVDGKKVEPNQLRNYLRGYSTSELKAARRSSKKSQIEICFTGFSAAHMDSLVSLAESSGMKVRKSVTENLDFLCIGRNAGPKKIEMARSQGVSILREHEFNALIDTGELPS